MSCVLRISGTALDIDALLSSVALAPNRTWRKGELRSKAVARTHADSGASFIASDAEFDAFDQQIADAITFLSSNSAAVTALASFAGVEQLSTSVLPCLRAASPRSLVYLRALSSSPQWPNLASKSPRMPVAPDSVPRANYLLKRTAATACGMLTLLAAAAA